MIRMSFILWITLILLPGPALALAPELAGIFPAVASPGSLVSITGGPFEQQVQIVFGVLTLQPTNITEKRITFSVPALPEGDYLLFLQQGQEKSAHSLFFRIALPAPGIVSLVPSKVEACVTGDRRQVTIQGRDILPGTQVLLDGVALAADRDDNNMTISLPELTPGMHQVQLVNPNGKYSLPVGLLVDALPEIQSVSQGEANVNYYELRISGKNFSYNSTLVVNGRPLTPFIPDHYRSTASPFATATP